MKELLIWVKDRIKGNLNTVKKVKIVPDVYMIPDEKGFPAMGVVDEGIQRENIKNQIKEKLNIKIAIYQSVMREEASIIGDVKSQGIEDIIKDITNLFKNSFPEGGYYYNVIIKDESGTQALTSDYERFIVMKTINLVFYRIK